MTFFDVWFSTVVPLSRPLKAGTVGHLGHPGTLWKIRARFVCSHVLQMIRSAGIQPCAGCFFMVCPPFHVLQTAPPALLLLLSRLSHLSHAVPPVPLSRSPWDGTAGTAAFLSSLLRWIIRLTVDLPQLTCEAISRTDFPDWDSCRIRQSLCPDSLSPGFFRCSFSVE